MHPVAIDRSEAHVWYGRTATDDVPGAGDVLSPDESRRCEKLASPTLRADYRAAHVALRRILGRYLDVAPRAIVLGHETCLHCGAADHGRPAVLAPRTTLRFSLARSDGWWLVGVSDGPAVGVDLEQIAGWDVRTVAETVLAPGEQRFFDAQPTPQARKDVFYRSWVRKEAVLKATGQGIVVDLRTLDADPRSARSAAVRHDSPLGIRDWAVHDIPIARRLAAAVAVPAGERTGVKITACV